MKLTRREAIATMAAAVLPGTKPESLPLPPHSCDSWSEAAELLTQLERCSIEQLFDDRWPSWMHYVSAIQFAKDVAAFYGVGAAAQTEKDLGHLVTWLHRDSIPILGEHSTKDDRVWCVMIPARLSKGLQAEFAADRARFGLKPFHADRDWLCERSEHPFRTHEDRIRRRPLITA